MKQLVLVLFALAFSVFDASAQIITAQKRAPLGGEPIRLQYSCIYYRQGHADLRIDAQKLLYAKECNGVTHWVPMENECNRSFFETSFDADHSLTITAEVSRRPGDEIRFREAAFTMSVGSGGDNSLEHIAADTYIPGPGALLADMRDGGVYLTSSARTEGSTGSTHGYCAIWIP